MVFVLTCTRLVNFYNGQSNASVTLDQHSLLLDGKARILISLPRVLFFSGEFHPFRLPAPELWRDVLQKCAGGFNGVSIYLHWGLTAPNNNTVEFTVHNDVAAFYEVAKEVGLLVIARPGPYINAESAGGGIPSWTTNYAGLARTNASDYKEAWEPYIRKFSEDSAPYQYPDGPLIAVQSENEYFTSSSLRIPGLSEHMQDIIDTYRVNGLTKIPTIHNDKNAGGIFSQKGLGKVDLYGWDGYPLGFDCDRPERWTELSTQHDASHQRLNPAEPLALFEWQGGAFSYWSGPGYDSCYKLINEQFANVYYKNNYAAGAALQNLYMTYGGTNWGNMHTHTIYSSYDYGAAISEDRLLTLKLHEIKLQSLFLHASPDYLLVGRIGNATGLHTDSSDTYTTHLHSPQTKANFYFVRQNTNQKTTDTVFTLRVNSTLAGGSEGEKEVEIPNVTLKGRESKILVSNYPFGNSTLEYSSAEVLTWGTYDEVDTIVLYAFQGQPVEISVVVSSANPQVAQAGSTIVPTFTVTPLTLLHKTVKLSGTTSGVSVFTFDSKRVIVVDKETAYGFWAPRLNVEGSDDTNVLYDLTPGTPHVLLTGPYLVRSASTEGNTLHLVGDINGTEPSTTLEVFAPTSFDAVTWNGSPVEVNETELGTLKGTINPAEDLKEVEVPVLTELEWACADSLPELREDFDEIDGEWIVADKTETQRPLKMLSGKNVLYGPEYGFHAGDWVWRGHFTGNATGVQLSVQGGFSFAYSAWLNSHFLGSGQGSSHSQDGVDLLSANFTFQPEWLKDENVVTVIHDSTGMNQDYNVNDEHKTPRGIRGYKLLTADNTTDFTEWKVAGNIGGENAPDRIRGPYNEGGWWFEREGAHLPGYDASSWNQSCSPTTGITAPGVTVYRTTFDLNFPQNADIPLSFEFALTNNTEAVNNPYRSLIFVNGWQFGRFVSSLGPQTSYPVPEGILNHHGSNEVLLTLWALNEGGAKLGRLELKKRGVLSSSKKADVQIVEAPGWNELRG
ncbi:glycoside hydrolase family 35 protein [Marasmius fiardii PR-910]|nr:glycoside hydrolase family 35 protein [Marasmius fiardii PR-910]